MDSEICWKIKLIGNYWRIFAWLVLIGGLILSFFQCVLTGTNPFLIIIGLVCNCYFALSWLIAGYGMNKLKPWAWAFTIFNSIITCIITIGYSFLVYFQASSDKKIVEEFSQFIFIQFLFFILPSFITIYYFTRPKVKRQFTGAES